MCLTWCSGVRRNQEGIVGLLRQQGAYHVTTRLDGTRTGAQSGFISGLGWYDLTCSPKDISPIP